MTDFILEENTLLAENITLGINLKCEVAVNISTNTFSLGTSENFFAGIKILNSTVNVTKESTFRIAFQLTVPIGCYEVVGSVVTCPSIAELSLMDVSQDQNTCNSLLKSKSSRCDAEIETISDFTLWDPTKIYTKELVTTDVNHADVDTITLMLQVDDNTRHVIWNGYQPQSVTVLVIEEDYRQKHCYAKIDPHMKTVDGIYYEHHRTGDYLLYKNIVYDIEVQVRFGICSPYYSYPKCACAVIVRTGGDIFEFNVCNTTRYINFKTCEARGSPILQVREVSDYLYKVHTPIGTIVQIKSWRYRNRVINVQVFMAPKDKNNVVGLCGNYDDAKSNDLQKRDGSTIQFFNNYMSYYLFSDDWILLSNETLFDVNNYYKHGRWEDTNALFCYCNETSPLVFESVCSAILDKGCAVTLENDKTERLCTVIGNRKRRSTDGHLKEMRRRLNRAYIKPNHGIQKRQDTDTVSEEEAILACNRTLTGSPAAGLGLLAESEIQAAINNCIYDVVEMNDPTFPKVHETILTNTINTEIEKDPVYQNESQEEIIDFRLNSCENNCSGNGNCTGEGICDCSNGYHGHDCSIDERQALIIDDITGAGFCDTTLDTCECYDVITLDLLEDFSCHTQQILVYENLTEQMIYNSTYTGLKISTFEGECCVPLQIDMSANSNGFWVKYVVSISNDGITFSNNRTLHLYDGSCKNPSSNDSESAVVSLDNGYCYINGVCFVENETEVSDPCLACKPDVDQRQWTYDCEELSPSITTSISTQSSTSTSPPIVYTSGTTTGDVNSKPSASSSVAISPETTVALTTKATSVIFTSHSTLAETADLSSTSSENVPTQHTSTSINEEYTSISTQSLRTTSPPIINTSGTTTEDVNSSPSASSSVAISPETPTALNTKATSDIFTSHSTSDLSSTSSEKIPTQHTSTSTNEEYTTNSTQNIKSTVQYDSTTRNEEYTADINNQTTSDDASRSFMPTTASPTSANGTTDLGDTETPLTKEDDDTNNTTFIIASVTWGCRFS